MTHEFIQYDYDNAYLVCKVCNMTVYESTVHNNYYITFVYDWENRNICCDDFTCNEYIMRSVI
jgi:hypothetical protein